MPNYGYGSYNEINIFLSFFAILKVYLFAIFIIGILLIISMYKIYRKAGKQGWEVLVPVYNIIVLLQIVELPLWYIVLFFIPFVNIYAIFKIFIELAHKFGKTTGFGIACFFFNFVCIPILAFGSAQYEGNSDFHESTFSTQNSHLEGVSQTLVDVKFCPNCGNKMNITSDTCFMCGKKF